MPSVPLTDNPKPFNHFANIHSIVSARPPIFRPVWVSGVFIFAMLIGAIALLTNTAWRSLQRLQPIHTHLVYLNQLQQIELGLQQFLVFPTNKNVRRLDDDIDHLKSKVRNLIQIDGALADNTYARLQVLTKAIGSMDVLSAKNVTSLLNGMHDIIRDEANAHDKLLSSVDHDTRFELEVATGLGIAVPLIAITLIFFLRRRILLPLDNLGNLMKLLAERDYQSVPIKDVDQMLQPLFHNYNHMVNRLVELERDHNLRQQTLEEEVRAATKTLMEQQKNLARAERLAAVGEVTAGLAHELRNPLAGMQITLENLQSDFSNTEQGQRLNLIINELKRVTNLLNSALNHSRQLPESMLVINVRDVVTEFCALMRYQISDKIEIFNYLPEGLEYCLPEGNLRQALMNLVLNAAQAIGDRPGKISIHAEKIHSSLIISVCDTGPGFPAELVKGGVRSFASWREDGTGLGLSMVRRFARDLGGELRLSNPSNGGACATIELRVDNDHG
jgi:two-component system NtrC family sensor kinase